MKNKVFVICYKGRPLRVFSDEVKAVKHFEERVNPPKHKNIPFHIEPVPEEELTIEVFFLNGGGTGELIVRENDKYVRYKDARFDGFVDIEENE